MWLPAVLALLAHGYTVQPAPVAAGEEAEDAADGETDPPAGGEKPAPQVYDGEVPPLRDPPSPDSPPPLKARRPGSGFNLEFGAFFGGDDLVRADFDNGETRTLTAGGGMYLSVGAMWTPRWSERNVGVGLGFNVGYKGSTLEARNGSAFLTRFPLAASGHLLFPASPRWFFLIRGGAVTDLGVRVTGNGIAARLGADLSSSIGPLVELGLLHLAGSRSGLGLAVRYAALEYTLWGPGIDASSVGVVGSWHHNY